MLLGLKASVSITDYPYALMDGYVYSMGCCLDRKASASITDDNRLPVCAHGHGWIIRYGMLLGIKASVWIPDYLYALMDGDVGMGCLLLGLKASVSITDFCFFEHAWGVEGSTGMTVGLHGNGSWSQLHLAV